jgi:hypothetical protein
MQNEEGGGGFANCELRIANCDWGLGIGDWGNGAGGGRRVEETKGSGHSFGCDSFAFVWLFIAHLIGHFVES